MVQLLYFASLREALGVGSEQVEIPGEVGNVADLKNWLQERGEEWQVALANQNLLVAVNQEIVSADFPVSDGDEVALFPPVTGG